VWGGGVGGVSGSPDLRDNTRTNPHEPTRARHSRNGAAVSHNVSGGMRARWHFVLNDSELKREASR